MKPSTLARSFAIGVLLIATTRFASANLITNGDFETGDFTGWTVTHASSGSLIFVDHGVGPDTTFGAFFGAFGTDFDSISQTFATTPGASYTLSFFYQINNTESPANNYFNVLWNGVSIGGGLFPQSNVNPGYGTFTFTEQATGTSTTLEFDGRNLPSFDFLDDVSVQRVQTVPDAGNSALLLGLAMAGLVLIRPAFLRSALR
jgi:hypothetical protein